MPWFTHLEETVNMLNKLLKIIADIGFICLLVFGLSACGGGGGSPAVAEQSYTPPPPPTTTTYTPARLEWYKLLCH